MAFLVTCVTWGGQASLTTAAPAEVSAAAANAETDKDTAEESQKIVINLAARSLALVRNDKKVRLYPIGPGKASTPTPVGYYKVRDMEINPTWTDPSDPEFSIASGEYNPLGYRWILIYGNYGIHGTNNPDSVGHFVSNGCIRMLEPDVEELYDNIDVGTPIEITYNRIVVEKTADDTVVYYIYPDGYGRQNVTVADVNNWLSGFGVENFEPDAQIEKKIELSDGEPTYVAKAYPLFVNGEKLQGKAVVKDNMTYLPAGDIAEAKQLALDWKPGSEVVVTPFGKASAYARKNVLYCNADDAAALFHLSGGMNRDGAYELKDIVVPVTQQPVPQQPVQAEPQQQSAQPPMASPQPSGPATQQPANPEGPTAQQPANPEGPAAQQPASAEERTEQTAGPSAPRSAAEAEQMAQEEAARKVREAREKEEARQASRERQTTEVPTRSARNNTSMTTVITNRAVEVG